MRFPLFYMEKSLQFFWPFSLVCAKANEFSGGRVVPRTKGRDYFVPLSHKKELVMKGSKTKPEK